jgi:ADP-ribose pyrophosphatase
MPPLSASHPARLIAMGSRVRVLTSKSVYEGRVVRLKVDRVVEPGGIEATREVVLHAGSVVVLPRLPDGRVLLVRQFRYAAGCPLWELVAGGVEPGESLRAAARRELLEETGYRTRRITPLLEFFPSPGILSERMHLFEAADLTRSDARPEPDERIRVGIFTLQQIRKMLRARRIRDGKTLVGLSWLLLSRSMLI